jgi:hypothetical protein
MKVLIKITVSCLLTLSFSFLIYSCNFTRSEDQKHLSEGLMFAILRNFEEGTKTYDQVHKYAIMDFNPFSDNFGGIKQSINGPLGHHSYVSPINGNVYVTLADKLVSKLDISVGSDGQAKIERINPSLPDKGLRVGEDIVWFKENGKDRYAVTSLDGDGDKLLGGINVYDANTDQLVRTITDAVKLRYSHGISIFDDKPIGLVASVIHEDIALYGIPSIDSLGHEVSLVNFETGKVIRNYDLGSTPQGFPVAPVECAIFRKSFHPKFEKNEKALVVEMVSGNLVSANWNEANGEFDEFQVAYSPKDEKEYFPLEIFVDESKIYVTYAERVKTFDLLEYASTGKLVDAGVEYITKSCAHHLSFFDVTNPKNGEKIPVLLIQQNLLNLGQQSFNIKFGLPINLGAHEVTAYNRLTGEVLKSVNIASLHNQGVEFVGGIKQDAYLHHH